MSLLVHGNWKNVLIQLRRHYQLRGGRYFAPAEIIRVKHIWDELQINHASFNLEDFPAYGLIPEDIRRDLLYHDEAERFASLALLCESFLSTYHITLLKEGSSPVKPDKSKESINASVNKLQDLFNSHLPKIQKAISERLEELERHKQMILLAEQERQAEQERRKQEIERIAQARLVEAERLRHEQELQRQQQIRIRQEKISTLLTQTKHGIRVNWLCSDLEIATMTNDIDSCNEIDSVRRSMALDWLSQSGLQKPTEEQLSFIIDAHHSIRLTARAGSGKTETIATKILFLIHFIGLNCSHILALVFNTEARDDLINRVESLETKAGFPTKGPYAIMNFDRLARGVVCPTAKIVKGDELQRVVRKLVHQFLSGANENSELIRQIMLTSFRSDWEKWLRTNERYTQEQLANLRSTLTEEAIDGTLIKSKGEKRLADFFFEHQLDYQYEYPWRTDRGVVIYPDFYLPQLRLVVEYWGLAGDKDYDESSEFKRRYWSTNDGYTLVEIYPENLPGLAPDFLEGLEVDYSFIADLITRACLERGFNITLRRLSDEELLDKLKMRIETEFEKLVSTSLTRLGQRCRSNADVISLVNAFHTSDEAERQFVNLLPSIDQAYRHMLASAQPTSIDFSQLKWKCIDLLAKGVESFSVDKNTRRVFPDQLRYIFIDEFQDFSELYLQIVTSLLGLSDGAVVNAVGDDWQMINRFAGSDISLFEGFSTIFPRPHDLSLSINFRSHRKIVDFCNALMEGEGNPVKPSEHLLQSRGRISEVPLTALELNDAEEHYFRSDPMLSALLRLIPSSITRLGLLDSAKRTMQEDDQSASSKPLVYVLSRTKRPRGLKVKPADISFVHNSKQADLLFLEEALTVVSKKQLPASAIRVLTAHSSKGKEAEVVMLLAPEQFPLIHPSSAFLSIFGDDLVQIINDERRLFYLACSRARKWLLLLTSAPEIQPGFLPRELLDPFDWNEAPYVLSVPQGRYRIEVASIPVSPSATYHIKEDLKVRGFKYDSTSPNHVWRQTLENDLPNVAKYLTELIADFELSKVKWALFDAAGTILFSWPGPVDPVSFLSASIAAEP